MKYITIKQFNKASEKVQYFILDWWEPSDGDLMYNLDTKEREVFEASFMDTDCVHSQCVPLLTIGQLIDFIEDKTDGKIDTEYDSETGYDIQIYNSYNKYRPKFNFVDYGKSLLQALWQVACEIILNTN